MLPTGWFETPCIMNKPSQSDRMKWRGLGLRRDVGGEGKTLDRKKEMQGTGGDSVLARHVVPS